VNIARSLAEAETQLKTGIAITGEITDDEPTVEAAETEASTAADDSAEASTDGDKADTNEA